MKRRGLLLAGAAATGALIVGWGVMPPRSRLGSGLLMSPGQGDIALNGWIKIAPDGGVVLAMPRSEMGQGVHTAIPMLAAEELDVPLDSMRLEQAGADAIYGNVAMLLGGLPFHPLDEEREDGFGRIKATRWVVAKLARELGINATGGSSSIADAWDIVRIAAATARASLLGAASLQWKLPAAELMVKDGIVSHSSGRRASYGELARFAAATPPGTVVVKERAQWKLIGHPAPRLDVAAKVDGRALYGIDVRLPSMKFAVVRLCPMLGGSPGRIDAAAALAMRGVERLVQLPAYAGSTAGFAVVGSTSWHARQAAQAVQVDWQQRPAGALDTRRIAKSLAEKVRSEPGFTFYERGDVAQAESAAAKTVEAWYTAPYLAHATLEPMNATARAGNGRVELWMPTQVPQLCRAEAARVAGVPLDKVDLHVTYLGGGFGRRLEVDVAAQATRVALDCGGSPVQLLWPREEDTTHDFYRPMQVAMLRASIDKDGGISGFRVKSAGDAIQPRWMARNVPMLSGPVDVPDKTTAEGLFDLPYGVTHQRMEHVATLSGVPVGFWRSVGHSHNAFFSESFVDELAHELRQDPFELRRKLLKGQPRHLAVLELAASKAGWGTPMLAGRARGIALHESFGSIVAQVAEVSLEGGSPRVHRVVCAIDCGVVVNPDIVAQQMEGAIVFALSASLHGRIDIHESVVQQGNFPAYPMVRMGSAPKIETWIVPSQRAPAGVGEPGVPPLAPAVANALRVMTGKPCRSLPIVA